MNSKSIYKYDVILPALEKMGYLFVAYIDDKSKPQRAKWKIFAKGYNTEPFAEDISSTEEMIDIAIADAGLAFSNIGLITIEKWDSLDIYEKAGFIFAHMYHI